MKSQSAAGLAFEQIYFRGKQMPKKTESTTGGEGGGH